MLIEWDDRLLLFIQKVFWIIILIEWEINYFIILTVVIYLVSKILLHYSAKGANRNSLLFWGGERITARKIVFVPSVSVPKPQQ